jgi:hypothetical protein
VTAVALSKCIAIKTPVAIANPKLTDAQMTSTCAGVSAFLNAWIGESLRGSPRTLAGALSVLVSAAHVMGSVNASAVIAVKQVTPTRLRLKHAVPVPGAKAVGRSAWILHAEGS